MARFGDFSVLSSSRDRLLWLGAEHALLLLAFEISFMEESLNDSTLDITELNCDSIGSSIVSSPSLVSGLDGSRAGSILLELGVTAALVLAFGDSSCSGAFVGGGQGFDSLII